MNAKFLAASLALALGGAGATPAGAATVYVVLTDPSVNGGAPTTVASGPSGTNLTWSGAYGSFGIPEILVAAGSTASNLYFGSVSLTLLAPLASSLTIDVLETGISMPVGPLNFNTSLGSLELPPGWTVSEIANYGPPTGPAITLGSGQFSGVGSLIESKMIDAMGAYLVDERYVFDFPGSAQPGQGIARITVTASSVPEPSTWAMMTLGFAGLGFFGYRKTKSSRTALSAA